MKSDNITIQIKVHRLALQSLENEPWHTAPIVADHLKTYGFKSFTAPREGSCGFDEAFKSARSEDVNWIIWEFKLPKLKAVDGSQESSYTSIHAIRATIQTLLCVGMRRIERNTGWHFNQLMILDGLALAGPSGGRGTGSLTVTLTLDATNWLDQPENIKLLDEVVTSMRKASAFLWEGSQRNDKFEASFRNSWFSLHVPGDAAFINGERSRPREGLELSGHNLDSSTQQFTLLAGLARLHDLMRKRH